MTTTSYDSQDPTIHVVLADGVLQTLHLPRSEDPRSLLEATRCALTEALTCHARDVRAQSREPSPNADPAREEVLRRAEAELRRAREEHAPARSARRADGRDPSGLVHVSLTFTEVVLLEVPASLFDSPTEAGRAILAAVNQALERLRRDVTTALQRRSPRADRETTIDWDETATRLRRMDQGYV